MTAAWPVRKAEFQDLEALAKALYCSAQDVREGLPSLELRQCPAKATLVRQGETRQEVFVLLKGRASVARTRWMFFKTEVGRLGPGDVFGEIGFLLAEPRSATVTAEEPCEVFRMSAGDLKALLQRRPSMRARLEDLAKRRLYALRSA